MEADHLTQSYYPQKEELEALGVCNNLEKYIEIIVFFATDPFTRLGDDDICDAKEYRETVEYCQNLISNITENSSKNTDENKEISVKNSSIWKS